MPQPIPELNGKPLEWPECKTQLKVSIGTQDKEKFLEDKLCVHGILQSFCDNGTARHIENINEDKDDHLCSWEGMC